MLILEKKSFLNEEEKLKVETLESLIPSVKKEIQIDVLEKMIYEIYLEATKRHKQNLEK